MARPKMDESEKLIPRTFRITQDQATRLDALSANTPFSEQHHMRLALEEYLEANGSAPTMPTRVPTRLR